MDEEEVKQSVCGGGLGQVERCGAGPWVEAVSCAPESENGISVPRDR